MNLDWTFSFSHLASVSPDNEGIFILQIVGILMGVLGLVFFLKPWEWFDFLISLPVCMRQGRGILYPQC